MRVWVDVRLVVEVPDNMAFGEVLDQLVEAVTNLPIGDSRVVTVEDWGIQR